MGDPEEHKDEELSVEKEAPKEEAAPPTETVKEGDPQPAENPQVA
jgi:hypothetical protein